MIFLLDCLLEVLRTEDLQKNNEALLYCMGAVKFMSGNAELLSEMVDKGAVEMLLQLMKQINNTKESDAHFSNLGHLLVQVSIYFYFWKYALQGQIKSLIRGDELTLCHWWICACIWTNFFLRDLCEVAQDLNLTMIPLCRQF